MKKNEEIAKLLKEIFEAIKDALGFSGDDAKILSNLLTVYSFTTPSNAIAGVILKAVATAVSKLTDPIANHLDEAAEKLLLPSETAQEIINRREEYNKSVQIADDDIYKEVINADRAKDWWDNIQQLVYTNGSIISLDSIGKIEELIGKLNNYIKGNANIVFDGYKIQDYDYLLTKMEDIINKSRADKQIEILKPSFDVADREIENIKEQISILENLMGSFDDEGSIAYKYYKSKEDYETKKADYYNRLNIGGVAEIEYEEYIKSKADYEAKEAKFNDTKDQIAVLKDLRDSYQSVIDEYKSINYDSEIDIVETIRHHQEEMENYNEWRTIQEKEKHKYVVNQNTEEAIENINIDNQKPLDVTQNTPTNDTQAPDVPTITPEINTQPMTDAVSTALEEIAAIAGESGTKSADNFVDAFVNKFKIRAEDLSKMLQETVSTVEYVSSLNSSAAYTSTVYNYSTENLSESSRNKSDINRLIEEINKPIYITLDKEVLGEAVISFGKQRGRMTRSNGGVI